MSYDIEGVYNPDSKRRTRILETSQVVGITALHAVITPVAIIAGATKSFSNSVREIMRTDSESSRERNRDLMTVTSRTAVSLPNQLLSDFVEVTRTENPLISEARRF